MWYKLSTINQGTPAFKFLLLTDALLLLTELMALVILPWWITSSDGVTALAIYSTVIAIAVFLSMPIASPFGDKCCKVSQIKYGIIVLSGTGLLLTLYASSGRFSLLPVIILGSIQVVANEWVDQARSAVIAEVVPAAALPSAIHLRKTSQSISGIFGPLVAGVTLSVAGVAGAMATYVGLLLMALFLAMRISASPVASGARGGVHEWWLELQQGIRAKWQMPMERGWTIVNFFVWIFQGPAVGILIPIKVQSLGLGGSWLGLGLGALSAGVLLGSALGVQHLVKRFGRYRVRIGLGFTEGLCLALVGFTSSPYLLLFALVMSGFCNAAVTLVGATHKMLAVPRHFRVRLSAVSAMTTQVAGAIGPAIVGLALTRWSVDFVYTGVGLLMSACVLLLLAVPRLKEFLSLEHEHITDWYAQQYPKIFGTRN